MAAYAVTRYSTENADYAVVLASLETQLETLDSTNDPVVMCTVQFNSQSGKWVGMLLTS